jgi:L-malate glycosyltransferase
MQKHILHVFSAFRIGGTESRTCQIINHFGEKYRHTICSLEDNFEAQSLLRKDVDVAFVLIKPKRYNVIENVYRFRQLLRRMRPDILITHAWGTMEWAIANAFAKLCSNIHALEGFGSDEVDSQKVRRRLARIMILPTCSKVVVCSENLLQLAIRSWHVPRENILFIQNGVDLNLFGPRHKERTRTDKKDKTVLGTVASLTSLKNHLRLFRVLDGIQDDIDFELLVAGDGPERMNLERFVSLSSRLRYRVKFLGHCSEPWRVLREIDIFCSSSDTEQMPLAVLEAMAAGLPIMSSDAGDIGRMVCEGNKHFIVDRENEQKYRNRLVELIRSPELCATLGKLNRARCERFYTKEIMYRRYEQLYDSV